MAFTEIDEKLLVRAYQAGDERAFDTIVRTQYNALYAHALRRLTQHEAAEDAVQDTLLRAYRALPNLDGDLALRAWLHRILTNVCYDEGNRRRRQHGLVEKVAALPEEHAPDPIDDTVLHETVRVMSEALQDLPEAYREALVLRYVDGLSFREVAEVTGITEENARARVHRGRLALHKVFSRLAVMAAFIIPGLRRATHATDATSSATAAASPDAANLATQLTAHVVQAAPTVSRFADAASSFGAAKSALAAAAVTAVAAVSVPVAVHTVQDATESGNRPPAATAAPSPSHKEVTGTAVAPTTSTSSSPTSTSSSSTSSTTIPESLAHPFQATVAASTPTSQPKQSSGSTTTTSTAPPASGPVVEGQLAGNSLSASGAAPQWDVQGATTLTVNGKATQGTIAGRVFVYDDGTAESDGLTVTLGGKTLELRYRGNITDTSATDSSTTYRISAVYVFSGADAFGLADRGNVTVVFQVGSGNATLAFDLRGQSGS